LRESHRCMKCPNLPLNLRKPVLLVQHMGTHILFSRGISPADNPCGFCFNTGSTCAIYLKKGKGSHGGIQIDLERSRCPNLANLSVKRAANSTSSSPCTNAPLTCPICLPGSPAIWKYNLREHFRQRHENVNADLHQHLFNITKDEKTLMKNIFDLKPRITKKKRKAAARDNLAISEAHSVRQTLRLVLISR
ncbi:hypothetical protein BD410DRAFT_724399, partial [Rickenella mellea]